MRTVEVYCGDIHAGQLRELSHNLFEFSYDDSYIEDKKTLPISVNLPKSKDVYQSTVIFPFFTNMLPEGANRMAMCKMNKIDENDLFGMLQQVCGMDFIGNVHLRK